MRALGEKVIYGCAELHISRESKVSCGMKPIPQPSILDECESLGFVHGARRWRSHAGKRLYTWDGLHGEVEVFNGRGKHLGVQDAITGDWIGEAVNGRKIDV